MPSNVNIFDKFGIKEVANVYFEALDDDLAAGVYKGDIVLYLDTLKVSTIETSAENIAAQIEKRAEAAAVSGDAR